MKRLNGLQIDLNVTAATSLKINNGVCVLQALNAFAVMWIDGRWLAAVLKTAMGCRLRALF